MARKSKEKDREENLLEMESILKEIKEEKAEANEKKENLFKIELTEEEKEELKKEIIKLLKTETIHKENNQIKKKKTEYSKKVTNAAVVLAYLFVIFVCYEMHITQNLEPVAAIGAGIVLMLAIVVRAYMKRAYQADLVNMKVNQAEKLSQLKEKYGDNFIYEVIEDVDLDGSA